MDILAPMVLVEERVRSIVRKLRLSRSYFFVLECRAQASDNRT